MGLPKPYSWAYNQGRVILREPFKNDIVYTRENIQRCVLNIEGQKSRYRTREAFESHLRKYQEGLDLLNSSEQQERSGADDLRAAVRDLQDRVAKLEAAGK